MKIPSRIILPLLCTCAWNVRLAARSNPTRARAASGWPASSRRSTLPLPSLRSLRGDSSSSTSGVLGHSDSAQSLNHPRRRSLFHPSRAKAIGTPSKKLFEHPLQPGCPCSTCDENHSRFAVRLRELTSTPHSTHPLDSPLNLVTDIVHRPDLSISQPPRTNTILPRGQ